MEGATTGTKAEGDCIQCYRLNLQCDRALPKCKQCDQSEAVCDFPEPRKPVSSNIEYEQQNRQDNLQLIRQTFDFVECKPNITKTDLNKSDQHSMSQPGTTSQIFHNPSQSNSLNMDNKVEILQPPASNRSSSYENRTYQLSHQLSETSQILPPYVNENSRSSSTSFSTDQKPKPDQQLYGYPSSDISSKPNYYPNNSYSVQTNGAAPTSYSSHPELNSVYRDRERPPYNKHDFPSPDYQNPNHLSNRNVQPIPANSGYYNSPIHPTSLPNTGSIVPHDYRGITPQSYSRAPHPNYNNFNGFNGAPLSNNSKYLYSMETNLAEKHDLSYNRLPLTNSSTSHEPLSDSQYAQNNQTNSRQTLNHYAPPPPSNHGTELQPLVIPSRFPERASSSKGGYVDTYNNTEGSKYHSDYNFYAKTDCGNQDASKGSSTKYKNMYSDDRDRYPNLAEQPLETIRYQSSSKGHYEQNPSSPYVQGTHLGLSKSLRPHMTFARSYSPEHTFALPSSHPRNRIYSLRSPPFYPYPRRHPNVDYGVSGPHGPTLESYYPNITSTKFSTVSNPEIKLPNYHESQISRRSVQEQGNHEYIPHYKHGPLINYPRNVADLNYRELDSDTISRGNGQISPALQIKQAYTPQMMRELKYPIDMPALNTKSIVPKPHEAPQHFHKQACDNCYRGKLKCTRALPSCSRCASRGLECTYTRPSSKRFTLNGENHTSKIQCNINVFKCENSSKREMNFINHEQPLAKKVNILSREKKVKTKKKKSVKPIKSEGRPTETLQIPSGINSEDLTISSSSHKDTSEL